MNSPKSPKIELKVVGAVVLDVGSQKSPKVSAKRKKSTADGNCCAACNLEATAPMSCSGCVEYFCVSCINLPERKCPRCVTEAAALSKMPPPSCAGHPGKELAFYCLTCEVEICSECILAAVNHKRHPFDRLEAINQEKIALTDKIAKIGLQIGKVEKYAEMARKNLDVITTVGETMLTDLQAMHDAAKTEVLEIVAEKREELEKRINLPVERKALEKQLQDDIKALGQFGFIKRQEQINVQCDKVLALCQDFPTDMVDYYDIGCELIPATKMSTYKVDWIAGKQEMLNVTIDDSTGEAWKVSLIKGDMMVRLKVGPNESVPLITSHKFKVVTEISNKDISKTLRKRFEIPRKMAQFELANVELLTAEGYLEDETMLFHIAIEPLNVIEAHDHYKEKVLMLKKSVDHYKSQLNASKESYDTLKNNNDCLKNFAMGFFPLDYGSIQKQSKNGFVSPNIVDLNGNEWKMEIKFDRDEFNKILLSAYIFPARFINNSENARRCAYFIELLHSNPEEVVRGYAENLFDEGGLGRGWKGFVERMRVLNDVGFMRNGKVWFRYGVRPSA